MNTNRLIHFIVSIVSLLLFTNNVTKGQNVSNYLTGHINGSYENYTQYYMKDSKINAETPDNKFASNGFYKLDYNYGDFSAGIQYESYLPSIYGYFPTSTINGSKIVNKYFNYSSSKFSLQIGDCYEQFGSGLIFRAFENRQIGINNAIEGMKLNVMPTDYIKLKVIYGKTRELFDYSKTYTRGADAEIDLIPLFTSSKSTSTVNLTIGGSFVSKYEEYTGPQNDFPNTVNALSGRMNYSSNHFSLSGEYVNKNSDPILLNNYSLKKGKALQFNSAFTKNNFGVSVDCRALSNMIFIADRDNENISIGLLNYLPALTKQHDNLTSNIYVYSAQPKGEIGFQSDCYYTFKKNSSIGGKYGTTISGNYSYYQSLNDSSDLLSFGKKKYYSDANIELRKKWSKKLETTFMVQNIFYNGSLKVASHPNVISNILAAGMIYKFAPKKSVRLKLEHLSAKNDKGNWASAVTEFSFSSPFAFFASDLYNYGTSKIHYYNIGSSITNKSTRFSLAYGRQREGLFCAGGVCRSIPASYGFTATLTTSFSN